MNEPEDQLHTHFEIQRAREEMRAPSFAAISRRAREMAARGGGKSRRSGWLWLAPAATAVVLAVFHSRPSPPPMSDYSGRIAALLDEFDASAFDRTTLPSDFLPAAFSQP
jgi:hypothetical protein